VQPTELPPRTAKPAQPAAEDTAPTLRDEVVGLARALPGDLRRLTVRSGDRAIEVEWAADSPGTDDGSRRAAPAVAPQPGADGSADGSPEVPEGLTAVRAPLVGTFYVAPSPDADPFVGEGDEVEAGQTLAIVEAMKLMNPILAEEPGVVAEVLVEDAGSVEYDQVLMLLRPTERPR
jgi:acetyl-CoA carboxylase biotin carboxyl carrier protein